LGNKSALPQPNVPLLAKAPMVFTPENRWNRTQRYTKS
jgi:hypothetical protein